MLRADFLLMVHGGVLETQLGRARQPQLDSESVSSSSHGLSDATWSIIGSTDVPLCARQLADHHFVYRAGETVP
jgi:hypothetical protein